MSVHLDAAVRRDLARAALSLAASSAWRDVTLAKLAEAAGRPLPELYGASPREAP